MLTCEIVLRFRLCVLVYHTHSIRLIFSFQAKDPRPEVRADSRNEDNSQWIFRDPVMLPHNIDASVYENFEVQRPARPEEGAVDQVRVGRLAARGGHLRVEAHALGEAELREVHVHALCESGEGVRTHARCGPWRRRCPRGCGGTCGCWWSTIASYRCDAGSSTSPRVGRRGAGAGDRSSGRPRTGT